MLKLYQNIRKRRQELGHASAQITLDIYTHLTAQQQAQTADRFAEYLDSY